jgi:hypothetical protein
MTEINRGQEWHKTKELLRGLYPKWETTQVQIESWRDAFSVLNPEWLREAINVMYHRYSGADPKPKWLQQCFREVQAGKTGVPLDEGGQAEIHQSERLYITQQEQLEAECDQERMHDSVMSWDEDSRLHWATLAMNKYPFLKKYDPTKPETWSQTACGFVYCLRKMKFVNVQDRL